jgi:hypothetical protein
MLLFSRPFWALVNIFQFPPSGQKIGEFCHFKAPGTVIGDLMDSIRMALACIGWRAARSHDGEVFEACLGDPTGEIVLSRGCRGCRGVVRTTDRWYKCRVQASPTSWEADSYICKFRAVSKVKLKGDSNQSIWTKGDSSACKHWFICVALSSLSSY